MNDKNKKEQLIAEIKDFNTEEVKLFMDEDDIDDAVDIDEFFNADEVDHQHALEEHEEDIKYRVGLEVFSELEEEFYEEIINESKSVKKEGE